MQIYIQLTELLHLVFYENFSTVFARNFVVFVLRIDNMNCTLQIIFHQIARAFCIRQPYGKKYFHHRIKIYTVEYRYRKKA